MQSIKNALAEAFNPLKDEFIQNPYPIYAKLREHDPVHWSERTHSWLITRYDDVDSMLKNLTFGKRLQEKAAEGMEMWKDPEFAVLLQSRLDWMLNQDPPDHTRLRNLVNKAFTPKTVEGLRPHVQEIANALLDKVQGKKEMELVEEYSFPLPVTVIAEMLGVPASDRDKFRQWTHRMAVTFNLSGSKDSMRDAQKATVEFMDYLRPLVEDRRKNPKPDLITGLVQAEEEGQKLSVEELLSNAVLILLAGHETTVNLIGNGMLALFRHPDQLKLLLEHPEYIGSAVDEFLRYDSSVQLVRRVAGDDVEIRDKKIKKGDMVTMLLGAANRDPDHFADPEQLDITRKNNKYLSFGAGIHHCLGFALAKLEAEIAIATLLRRYPKLKLADKKVEYKPSPALRGVKAMHIQIS